jgi:hypothetical protein
METNKEDWEEELYRLASLVGTDARNPKGKLKEYVDKQITLAKEEEYEIGYKDGQSSKIADYTVQLEDFVDGSGAQEIIKKVKTEERKRIVEEIENTDCFYCYERGEREDGLLMKRKDVGEFKAELINKIK